MKQIKPTDTGLVITGIKVFLAGSIEMGAAEDWQTRVVKQFDKPEWNLNLTFFNPRRDQWDSSWKQSQAAPEFNHQVNWELNKLEESDIIFMYLDPKTKSPISLMEFGMYSEKGKLIVCCPEGFWRKGNIEVMCTRNNIQLFDNLEDAMGALETKIRKKLSSHPLN